MTNKQVRALLERLNTYCASLLEAGAGFAAARGHHEVLIEHVLVKALENGGPTDIVRVVDSFDVDQDRLFRALLDSLSRYRSGHVGKPALSQALCRWLERAWLATTLHYGGDEIRSVALLDALLDSDAVLSPDAVPGALDRIGLDTLRSDAERILAGSVEGGRSGAEEDAPSAPRGPNARENASGDSALERFTANLTAQAAEGGIDRVLGRNDEIRQVIDILCRRRKNNPILVGEPGVGKTAVAEGLALRIASGEVPPDLRQVALRSLDLGLLQAGASVKGEFERRLKQVIDEVTQSPTPVVLFIDEAHTLIGAGGDAGLGDAANLLKPALARGEMRTVAATTWSEYKQYFERDAALDRRFQMVKVAEPDEHRATLMLNGLKERYQAHHGVLITDAAVTAAVKLANRYIAGRQLPDKAIDLLDTAAARARMVRATVPPEVEAAREHLSFLEMRLAALDEEDRQGLAVDERLRDGLLTEKSATREKLQALEAEWAEQRDRIQRFTRLGRPEADAAAASPPPAPAEGRPLLPVDVDETAVAAVVADWTGVPVGRMLRDEAATLMRLEERLATRVVGQDDALRRIAHTLRTAKAGLGGGTGPLGVFLLTGPSGVGKTETAKAIAEELFGGERFLVTINMSEYREAHAVSQLKGSPPGYVGYGQGGVLTEAVRRRPYSVVLLDEADKAHPDVLNLFYQVFDRGMMRDGEGREIDFRNTVILMTANLGDETLRQATAPPAEVPDSENSEPAEPYTGRRSGIGELTELIRPDLARHFPQALLARLTVVPYAPLDGESLARIVALKLDATAQRLRAVHDLELRCTPQVIERLAAEATCTETGARRVDALVEQWLLPGAARTLLGFMAEEDMPDVMALETNDAGEIVCVFSDVQDSAAAAPA